MKNCIILGSGRSGTSMVAGTLAKSGYFMGDNLYPARESNPKGFFEDPFINGINEEILERMCFGAVESIKRKLSGIRLTDGQRWLEKIPLDARLPSSMALTEKILTAVNKAPFCYKDPRFSYTLPIWRPYLQNTVFICVFREPTVTAQSIIKECSAMEYLKSVKMSFKYALEIWFHIYNHILTTHIHEGEWLFLHYDQVLSFDGASRIEAIAESATDKSFPEEQFKRSSSTLECPSKHRKMYAQLCELARYQPSY